VILLDANILLAAHREDHPQHARVRPWFDEMLRRDEPFTVADATWASFIRIATNRRIFSVPTPLDETFGFLRSVRGQPQHVAMTPGERHLEIFERLCHTADAVGDLAADANIAAVAMEQDLEVVSLDRDFARFPDLRWRRPG